MPFAVEVADDAKIEIKKKLEKHLRERLFHRLKKLEYSPNIYGKPLHFPLAGVWEIYFENRWRILYTIDFSNSKVLIVGLRHKDEMS